MSNNIEKCEHDLFKQPYLSLKREIYRSLSRVEACIEAADKYITGTEKIAEEMLPKLIKKHNTLVKRLNNLLQ